MKILIATGSFKDVYTPVEVCSLLESLLSGKHLLKSVPMCDGGENTLTVLRRFFGERAEQITAENIFDPTGSLVDVPYLAVGDTAFLISAEILHLPLEKDIYKNPLELTDYGLGQLIVCALQKGYRKICLCLGGTSTISFGLGAAQALGTCFFDQDGNRLPSPLRLKDYDSIDSVQWNKETYKGIELTVINDGITRACDLTTVNPLKIGSHFVKEKETILQSIDQMAEKVFSVTGLTAEDAWSGNGGGIYFGMESIFHPLYLKGSNFFCELFHLEESIKDTDLVITGEGRFDNPHLEKIPVVVAEYAKRAGKPCILVCGEIAPELAVNKEGVHYNSFLKDTYGIDIVLSCTEDYCEIQPGGYTVAQLREMTPYILKKRFSEIGVL